MTIRSIDLGNSTLEIDTTYGEVVIFHSGSRTSISLNEASRMLSAMLMVINPSSMLQSTDIDPLQVHAIAQPREQIERISTRIEYTTLQHFTECQQCMNALQASSHKTFKEFKILSASIVKCVSQNDAIRPYLEQKIITSENVAFYIVPLLEKQVAKIKASVCSECGKPEGEVKICLQCGFCFTCIPVHMPCDGVYGFYEGKTYKLIEGNESPLQVTNCTGCVDEWCQGCVPDESVLHESPLDVTPHEICYICEAIVPYESTGNGEEWGIRGCAYCDRTVCKNHSFTDKTGNISCTMPKCKGTASEQYANSYQGVAPSEISEASRETYRQFLEDTVDNEEYNAWLEHSHTPKAEEY